MIQLLSAIMALIGFTTSVGAIYAWRAAREAEMDFQQCRMVCANTFKSLQDDRIAFEERRRSWSERVSRYERQQRKLAGVIEQVQEEERTVLDFLADR